MPRILQEESRGTAQENQSPVSAVHTNAGLQPGSRAPAQGSTGLSVKSVAGRSGLAVACLTAVREVLGSNRAVDSCVYHQKNTVIYSRARAVCTLPAVPRSTQPSTLRGMVNEYQLSG